MAFLAVQDSSIGDLVTHSVSDTPFDFRALKSFDDNYNDNDNGYRDSNLGLDLD